MKTTQETAENVNKQLKLNCDYKQAAEYLDKQVKLCIKKLTKIGMLWKTNSWKMIRVKCQPWNFQFIFENHKFGDRLMLSPISFHS